MIIVVVVVFLATITNPFRICCSQKSDPEKRQRRQQYGDDFIQAAYRSMSPASTSTVNGENVGDGGIGFTWRADVPPPPMLQTDDDDDNEKFQQILAMIWDRTDDLLTRYWPRTRDGYSFHQRQERQLEQGSEERGSGGRDSSSSKNDDLFTYGEVTPLGARQLVYEMGLFSGSQSSSSTATTTRTTFLDVGSGVGKLVVQLYLEYVEPSTKSSMKKVDSINPISQIIGVELSKQRHEVAVEAWNGVKEELSHRSTEEGCNTFDVDDVHTSQQEDTAAVENPQERQWGDVGSKRQFSTKIQEKIVRFIHGDALDVDFSEVTHVFMSSLCFPEDVLKEIQSKLLRHAPKLQVVASLNRLDMFVKHDDQIYDNDGQNGALTDRTHSDCVSISSSSESKWNERIVPIQMSWGPSTAKIYNRISVVQDREDFRCPGQPISFPNKTKDIS